VELVVVELVESAMGLVIVSIQQIVLIVQSILVVKSIIVLP
jgi:hypothetical protein